MAKHERYENRYGRDAGDKRERRSLLETIKRDVKSWFDDDDDDYDDVRSYDLRDRSGRRYRADHRDSGYRSGAGDYRYGRSRFPQETDDHERASYDYSSDDDFASSGTDRSSRYDRKYSRRGWDMRHRDYSRDGVVRDRDYYRSAGDRRPEVPYGGGYMDRDSAPGLYYGVGPKGYKRSPDRLKEQVCERLRDNGDLDASEIEVSVDDNCEVTLRGTVCSRREKRLAEDCAESCRGVEDVHNRLTINRHRDDDRDDSRATRRASKQSGNSQPG